MVTKERESKSESTRFEICKLIFLTVMEALEHEQRANTPMLMGMAFLTAAASAIFAAVYSRVSHQSPSDLVALQSHPLLISFGIFIVLILVGTLFSISAQRSKLTPLKAPEKAKLPSLFFWKAINEVPQDKWVKYINEAKEDELAASASEHLAREAHLVSSLVAYKHRQRGRASWCFLAALVAFAVFLGFALNTMFGWGAIWAAVFGLVLLLGVLWWIR